MNDIRAILKTAATRIGLTAFLGRLHIVAGIVAGVALLFALVSRLSPIFGIPWVWVGPIMALVAFATALAIWYRHRQTHLQVAIAVDDRLDLREKLSTALHMSAREDAFARAAIDDAVHTARDPRTREAVRRKFRIEPPTRWWIAPALLAATVVVASLIPQGDIFAGDDEQIQPAQFAHTELTDSFEASIEKIRKNDVLKDELKSVFEELEPTKLDPEAKKSEQALRREMIKNLSDLEDRLKKIENEKSKTSEALEKALKQLKSPAKEGPAAELAKALTEGNFEAAKNALQQMQTELEEGALTPEQRQQLSQQLEEMAQQMAQLAQEKKALEEALEQAGLDKNLAASPQALQQALQQNQNLTQQQKEQLQQMAQAQQIAGQMCQGMSAAMGQMSMAMGQGQGQMGQGAAQMGQLLSDAENLKMALGQCRAMMNDIQGQCQGLGQGLSQGLALRGRQGGRRLSR